MKAGANAATSPTTVPEVAEFYEYKTQACCAVTVRGHAFTIARGLPTM